VTVTGFRGFRFLADRVMTVYLAVVWPVVL